jgi:hypothetical protein
MTSDGTSRSGLLTAGGVLSIIGGGLEVIAGGLAALAVVILRALFGRGLLPFDPGPWFDRVPVLAPFWSIIIGLPIFALGVVAIIGGVSAVRRKSFGLSLAGAICALPTIILGILATIFIAVSKSAFRAEG